MGASQCILGLVQPSHDDLPVGIDFIKLCRLPGQLSPDVLPEEDVLQVHPLTLHGQQHLNNLQMSKDNIISNPLWYLKNVYIIYTNLNQIV